MTLGNGFDTPLLLSDELSEFLGAKMLCRTDVTRLMWTYIKENKLQSEKNGRTIICDETSKTFPSENNRYVSYD